MDSSLEIIDAFVDGERVDPIALKHALSDPAGRDYFVDAWTLRDIVRHDPEIASVNRRPGVSPQPRRARQWMVSAALLTGIAGGYFAGASRPLSPAPATPAATTTVARPSPAKDVFPAPVPTRVIQLEFHIDSTGSGGD
jgi:hypothetical protein